MIPGAFKSEKMERQGLQQWTQGNQKGAKRKPKAPEGNQTGAQANVIPKWTKNIPKSSLRAFGITFSNVDIFPQNCNGHGTCVGLTIVKRSSAFIVEENGNNISSTCRSYLNKRQMRAKKDARKGHHRNYALVGVPLVKGKSVEWFSKGQPPQTRCEFYSNIKPQYQKTHTNKLTTETLTKRDE